MSSNPYLLRDHVRAALRSLNIRPTRGMGQNFLTDARALTAIVDAAELAPTDTVLEVGPGLGVLTWELVQRAGHVVAVELDKRLAARLRSEFAGPTAAGTHQAAPLTIIQGDILKLAPAEVLRQAHPTPAPDPDAPPYKVVANLPYAITSPVLLHFLEQHPHPTLLVVLVQWEVAQRITAQPGSLNRLAHAIQFATHPEIVARVPAASFWPAPAVDSAIVRLRVRATPAVEVADPAALFRLIKAGFVQPRKKLSNALPGGLASMGDRRPREEVVAALIAAGVNPDRRAETLTLAEWAAVYRALPDDAA